LLGCGEEHSCGHNSNSCLCSEIALGSSNPRCVHGDPVHMFFVVDFSGSMAAKDCVPTSPVIANVQNNKAGAVFECVSSYLQSHENNSEDIATLITFNHTAKVIFNSLPISANLMVNHLIAEQPYGGTSFGKALIALKDAISKNKNSKKPLVVFLTDGENNGDNFLSILADIQKIIGKVNYKWLNLVLFSSSDSNSNLEEMRKLTNCPLVKHNNVDSLFTYFLDLRSHLGPRVGSMLLHH